MSSNQWTDSLIGRSFNGYRITKLIARGGMGIVFEGVQESLNRPVAMKILYPHLSDEENFRERFTREAQAAARLNHPNIVRVLDFGSDGMIHFMILDLISGESLSERLERIHADGLTYTIENTVTLIQQIGDALAYAHERGFVHRDVKPGNILIDESGRAYLTDFGVVAILGEGGMTATGMFVGTPEYMAPEQSLGTTTVGPAADQYSLAIVTYEMLVGRVPFKAPTPAATLRMQLTDSPPPPKSIIPWCPDSLDAALMKALSKNPEDRFESIGNFVASLRVAVYGEGAAAALTQGGRPIPTVVTSGTGGDGSSTPTPTTSSEDDGGSSRWRFVAIPIALVLVAAMFVAAAAAFMLMDNNDGTNNEDSRPTEAAVVPTNTPTTEPTIVSTPITEATVTELTTETPIPTATMTEEPVVTEVSTEAVIPEGFKSVILFASNRNEVHDSQIYIMNPDGSDQRQLTFASGHSWGPRVSPDGARFFFSSTAPGEHEDHTASGGGLSGTGNHDIYIADVDGSNVSNLTVEHLSWDNGWSWSPDGNWIAFASDRDTTEGAQTPNWEIYTMSLDGKTINRLTNHPGHDGWPTWTPDGEHIIFASDRGGAGDSDIYIMDADGSNVRPLLIRPETWDTHPSISPDGTLIVFAGQNSSQLEGEIYVMNIDGTEVTRLTSTAANNFVPSFSPDGTKIVFTSNRDGDDNIYMMNLDGSNPTRLTENPGEDTTPSWAYIRVTQ